MEEEVDSGLPNYKMVGKTAAIEEACQGLC